MPIWFTVEEERPDVGTVIFKADDYYEKLQHITGMWNENKYLYYDIFRSHHHHNRNLDRTLGDDQDKDQTIFGVNDIRDVPTLLAYLERANLKGVLPGPMMDFMWDLHKLYVRKMSEFGYATHRMSKKEYDLIENHEKWARLMKAMEELRKFNQSEELEAKKRKRKLLSVTLKTYTRLDTLPAKAKKLKEELLGYRDSTSRKSMRSSMGGGEDSMHELGFGSALHLDRENRILLRMKKGGKRRKFFYKEEYQNPFAWDFGKTRLFDRKHLRKAGSHIEFTRFYHKIARALRFSKSEPVDWRTISLDEVDRHRYLNDCWMVIKGRVYDVTDYLKKHPGGAHLIMQGAGIDATEVFDSVHPYVVFYNHLCRMQLGTLPEFEEHPHTEWEPPAYFDIFRVLKEWEKHPLAKYNPKTRFEQSETHFLYSVKFPSSLVSSESDWTVTITAGFQVTVIKYIEPPYVWYGGFDLRTRVMDDTAYRTFSDDFNSLQVKIAKSYKVKIRKPVKDWRQDHGLFLSAYSLKDKFRASVVERTRIADGVKLYGISVGVNKFIGCPIGSYVNLSILDETRPYTPVCLPDEFENRFEDESGEFQTLYFLIKEFKDGDFTSMLHYLPMKRILKGVELYVGPAMGNFKTGFLFENVDVMLLIAGGTGISVMTRIVQEYIQHKEKMVGVHVILLFFVQYREDVIWKDTWKQLDKKHHWFHFFHSLTRVYRYAVDKDHGGDGKGVKQAGFADGGVKKRPPTKALEFDPENKREMYGYPAISKLNHVYNLVDGAKKAEFQKAIICGPYGFNHSCGKMLELFGKHKEEDIHYFAA